MTMDEPRGRAPEFMARRHVVVLAGLMVLAAGCGSWLAPSTPAPSPIGLVATYRGDAARTGSMPGPAPSGTPSVVWTFKAGAPIGSSPLAVDGIVYVLGNDGVIHALVLETGEERWQAKLGEDASASPLIADGLLIVGDSTGIVHALAVADGSVRWTTATDGPISGAAAAGANVAVVATSSGSAYAIEMSTGAIRWKTALDGPVTTSVAIADGTVYVGASPNLMAIALADGTIRWTQPVSEDGRIGTPAVADGLVFAATGLDASDDSIHGVVALDAATGLQHWRFTSPTQATIYTPAIVDGRAYVVGEDHTVSALDAPSGKVIWATPTMEVNESVAAVADGLVFVAGNGGAMTAIDTATGVIDWTVPFKGIPYGPIVIDGYVIVGTNLGELVAISGPAE